MYSTRAAWYGYPDPVAMEYWTVSMGSEHAHVLAEGLAQASDTDATAAREGQKP